MDIAKLPYPYTGQSGGSPEKLTWDFIGIASADEMAVVVEIGPEIVFRGF